MINNYVNSYERNGFVKIPIFSQKQKTIINNFAENWFYKKISLNAGYSNLYPINKYHLWMKKLKIKHETIVEYKNRSIFTPSFIDKILLKNIKLINFFKQINVQIDKPHMEYNGYLSFRLIRPNKNDGFPLHKKVWGEKKNLISLWIPIVGKDKKHTLSLVPKSHKKEYNFYYPKNSKFRERDGRLNKKDEKNLKLFNPSLKDVDIILYSPNTLHSEMNINSSNTRFNLELRFETL